jgi:hypothetical protein
MSKLNIYLKQDFSENGKKVYEIFKEYLNDKNVIKIYNLDYKNIENYIIEFENTNKNIFILQLKLQDFINELENLKFKSNIVIEQFIQNNLFVLIDQNKCKYRSELLLEVLTGIVDYIIIPEAKYEKNIAITCEMMVELSKDVLVCPSNIYNETSYFSNYLIKQGADIVLSKKDIEWYIEK